MKNFETGIHPFIFCVMFLISMALFHGCTVSLTNVSTHGVASDLVDEEQAATADVKPNIQLTPGVL